MNDTTYTSNLAVNDTTYTSNLAVNDTTHTTSLIPARRQRPPTVAAAPSPVLPHHKLRAYGVARDLLVAVRACAVTDPVIRDHAVRSAKSAALNCAEGAGRVSPRDKARSFAIARAECVEAAAAVEIAALAGEASAEHAGEVARLADRLVGMLTRLIR